MMALNMRPLHFVLKVANLESSIKFYRNKLGMQVLRHEVFEKGCEATCNGPYDGKWSKTMIGFGPEDEHFVLELTYNYSIDGYKEGNLLKYIQIDLKASDYERVLVPDQKLPRQDPDFYPIQIRKSSENTSRITQVCMRSSNLDKSVEYWNGILGVDYYKSSSTSSSVDLKFANHDFTLRLSHDDVMIEKGSNFGRIAFSCPSSHLAPIQKRVEEVNYTVLTPLVSLDTPGKATVQVVILSDPDSHEICFVGDEGFRELSRIDPEADTLVEKSLQEDKSSEWFVKKQKSKQKV